jgi:hypothetical protein
MRLAHGDDNRMRKVSPLDNIRQKARPALARLTDDRNLRNTSMICRERRQHHRHGASARRCVPTEHLQRTLHLLNHRGVTSQV